MPGNVIFSGSLPGNACSYITDEASRFALYLSSMVGIAPSSAGVYVGTSPPADHSLVWLKLDPTSNYPVRFYFYYGGWCSPHPMIPGSTIIWTASGGMPDFTTFDGGDSSGVVSPVSGPMWELNTDLHGPVGTQVARVPLGIGVLPNNGSPITLTLTSPDAGADMVVLTPDQTPYHTHLTMFYSASVPQSTAYTTALNAVQNNFNSSNVYTGTVLNGIAQVANVGLSTSFGGDGSAVAAPPNNPVSLLPPYAPVLFLRRTARQFYYQAG
jgi:hypothetical protein